MSKQLILDKLNEIIVEEKGTPVNIRSMFTDAQLDSLGTLLTIAQLEADYPFFQGVALDEDAFKTLDIPNLTVRELIQKCVLSTTNTSTAPKSEKDT